MSLLTASSCSLPPRESWNEIQQKGLFPTMLANRGSNSERSTETNPSAPGEATPETDRSSQQLASSTEPEKEKPRNERRSSSAGTFGSGRYPTARPIPGATGYVYSPFEEGEKAVDVSSLSKGVKARCPYSGKVFIVPDFAAPVEDEKDSTPAIASVTDSGSAASERRRIASSRSDTSASSTPSLASRENDSSSSVNILPEPMLPPSPPETPESLAEKPDDTSETLEGTRVAGRPGYVRSPYAGSNQLVDVTGLTPGQEVRCPYSGKLFKVPAMGEMSDVTSPEPKADPSPPTEPDLPGEDSDETDETPVASSPESLPEPEEEEEEKPRIVKNDGPVELPSDATGLARPEPPKSPPAKPSLPVAKRIAGKKGLVRSPFGSDGQLVDVTGKSPGSQVLCPFTGKPFIVPK